MCDGIRCDMAYLALNDLIEQVRSLPRVLSPWHSRGPAHLGAFHYRTGATSSTRGVGRSPPPSGGRAPLRPSSRGSPTSSSSPKSTRRGRFAPHYAQPAVWKCLPPSAVWRTFILCSRDCRSLASTTPTTSSSTTVCRGVTSTTPRTGSSTTRPRSPSARPTVRRRRALLFSVVIRSRPYFFLRPYPTVVSNHDEPREAIHFGSWWRAAAAALLSFTLPVRRSPFAPFIEHSTYSPRNH